MQLGGGSKDTWVLGGADDSEPTRSSRRRRRRFTHATELSSRMADNLFWLGRYAERLEATARLVRVLLPGLSGESDQGRHASRRHRAALPPRPRPAAPAVAARHRGAPVVDACSACSPTWCSTPASIASIGWNLRQVRRLSWEVKERLSPDTWRVLQQLETQLSAAPAHQSRPALRGGAGRARRRGDHAVGVRGTAGREPDARPRLALPRTSAGAWSARCR